MSSLTAQGKAVGDSIDGRSENKNVGNVNSLFKSSKIRRPGVVGQ